jgi:integrase
VKKAELAIESYLTEDEVWKMAKLATSERNRLLVLTLFYSAFRIAEVLKLIPKDLLANNNIKVITKGSKAHEVGMPGWLMNELRAYIKANKIPSNQPIFKISPVTAWAIVKSLGRKINKDVYPHLFRHSRAIDLTEKTGRETIVQRHLGHRSSATTQIYFRGCPKTQFFKAPPDFLRTKFSKKASKKVFSDSLFRFIEEKKAAEVVKSLDEKPKTFTTIKNKPIVGKAK